MRLWVLLLLGACTNEPMYIPGPTNLEAGMAMPNFWASLSREG